MICQGFSKFRLWLVRLLIGKRPFIINCIFNGNGVKEGWFIISASGHDEKAVVTFK